MTDIKGCNQSCGCPYPCPGGKPCRCSSSEASSGLDPNMIHMRCSCGDHCGCNPCTCTKTPVTGVGKTNCTCSTEGCACVTCTS